MDDGWRLILGLGNPGEGYRNTRHNAGFMALATLAGAMGLEDAATFKRSLIAKGRLGRVRVILAWPQTYMNLSGLAARELVGFYKIGLPDVLVVHDDMDLEVGRLKATMGGGAAGHNGLVSLMEELGGEFARLRIGIGRPDRDSFGGDWTPWVLSAFASTELEAFDRSLALASKAAKAWATGDLSSAQRLVNVRRGKPKRAGTPDPSEDAGKRPAEGARATEDPGGGDASGTPEGTDAAGRPEDSPGPKES